MMAAAKAAMAALETVKQGKMTWAEAMFEKRERR
jgi:hypothetical protein